MQASLVQMIAGVRVVEHNTFHHNVPMFLERESQLVPLLKREMLTLLSRLPEG
jgi:leucine-rich repeat protein SHOC2